MLPDAALPVPASLMTLLAVFSPLFTAPSFRTFAMLACGFLAQPGKRTVCGMLTGAGLSRLWPHDRAHRFFSRARWNPDDLGLCAARLVISLLVPDGGPVEVLIDDTLFRRRGKRVWAASWFHDGSVAGPAKTGYGNNWVVLAVRVRLPMTSRRSGPGSGDGPARGDRLPSLAKIAPTAAFSQVTVTRYGKTETIAVHAFTCLWYCVTGAKTVTVVLIRDKSETGYDLALVTTQQRPGIAAVIERYAARWAIEVAIEDAKQLFGTGQARNRTARAVERTIPFMLACQAIAVTWYATAGHSPADTAARRANAPWYTAKTEPSTADMTAKLRRVIIAARFKPLRPDQPKPEEIHAIRLAWEDAEDLAA